MEKSSSKFEHQATDGKKHSKFNSIFSAFILFFILFVGFFFFNVVFRSVYLFWPYDDSEK